MTSKVRQYQMVQFNKKYQDTQDMLQKKQVQLSALQKDVEKLEQKIKQFEKKQEQWNKKDEQNKKKTKALEQEYETMVKQNQRKRKQLIQKALRDIRGPSIKPIEQQQQKPSKTVKKVVPDWMLKETLVDPAEKVEKAKQAFLMGQGKYRSKAKRYGIFA